MDENILLKTYAVAICMLSLLEEWEKIERIGVVAKIHNAISAKHNHFFEQINKIKRGKKKNCSKKCLLFIEANKLADFSWSRAAEEAKGVTISASSVIHALYRFNSENITRLYRLNEECFKKLDSKNNHGAVFQSSKMARLITESIENSLKDGSYKKRANIYNIKEK